MGTTVKTFLIGMLLIFTCSISGKAVGLARVDTESAEACKVSAVLSSCPSVSSTKPISEVYSFNQQRIRRVMEDNIFLRSIFLILSHHENLLAHDRTKQYFSDKDPYYAVTGSDYYIYALRRILI